MHKRSSKATIAFTFLMTISYSQHSQIESCTAAIQSGRLSGKDFAKAFYLRGIAYTNTRDYDRAIADFTEAIRRDSQYWSAYTERALIYLDKHDFDHAIADYNEAIRLYPDTIAIGIILIATALGVAATLACWSMEHGIATLERGIGTKCSRPVCLGFPEN